MVEVGLQSLDVAVLRIGKSAASEGGPHSVSFARCCGGLLLPLYLSYYLKSQSFRDNPIVPYRHVGKSLLMLSARLDTHPTSLAAGEIQ